MHKLQVSSTSCYTSFGLDWGLDGYGQPGGDDVAGRMVVLLGAAAFSRVEAKGLTKSPASWISVAGIVTDYCPLSEMWLVYLSRLSCGYDLGDTLPIGHSPLLLSTLKDSGPDVLVIMPPITTPIVAGFIQIKYLLSNNKLTNLRPLVVIFLLLLLFPINFLLHTVSV